MKKKIKFEDINWNTDEYPLQTDPKLSMEDLVKALGAKPIIKVDERLVDPSHVASIFKEKEAARLRPQKKVKIKYYTLEELQKAELPRRVFRPKVQKDFKLEEIRIGSRRTRFKKRRFISSKEGDTVEIHIHNNGLISANTNPINVVLETLHQASCVVSFPRQSNSQRENPIRIKMASIKSINMGLNRAVIKTINHSFNTSVTVANVIVGLNPKINVVETEKIKR